MKKILTTFLILAGMICASNLAAQEECCESTCNGNQGFYVGAIGGANWLNLNSLTANDVEVDNSVVSAKVQLHTKVGYLAGGVVGYKFCPLYLSSCFSMSPRVEAEFSYRNNKISRATITATATPVAAELADDAEALPVGVASQKVKVSRHMNTMTYMANFLVDLDFNMPVTPYVGVGIGYAHSWSKGWKGDRFAYQGIAGVSYAVCEGVDLCVDYRYMKAVKHSNDQAVCFGVKKYF